MANGKYVLTDEQKTTALRLAIEGKGLGRIREAIKMNADEFWKARIADPDFNRQWLDARHEGMEELADQLIDLPHDTSIDLMRVRQISDNTRWLLSKRKPQTYGDRLDVNLNQTLDLSATLREARERVVLPVPVSPLLPICDTNAHAETNSVELIEKNNATATDCKSVVEVDPFS